MTYLTKTTTGKIKKPYHLIIFGTAKIGKSTWAAESDEPIFADIEEGSAELNVTRLPKPASFADFMNMIQEMTVSEHGYKTLVIDSLDHLETLCNMDVAKQNGVASVGDLGFGKGYAQALVQWQKLYEALDLLQKKMNIICIAHSTLKKIDDPIRSAAYDKHDIKLREAMGALSKEKADGILFAVFEVNVAKDRSTGKGRASGDGSRILYTQGRPGHEGGNRFNLPYKLPLCFADFKNALNDSDSATAENLIKQMKEMLSEITDEDLKQKVLLSIEKAQKNTLQLTKVYDRLQTVLSTKGN